MMYLSKKKLKLVLGLAIVFGWFLLNSSISLAAQPRLYFKPDRVEVGVLDKFKAEIMVNTGSYSVAGVGVIINYDRNRIRVLSLVPGMIFGDYPLVSIDNVNGRIRVSGVVSSVNDLFLGQGVLAEVEIEVKGLGETRLEFEFEPGNTQDSNIAVMHGSGDVLAEVGSLTIVVDEFKVVESKEEDKPVRLVDVVRNPSIDSFIDWVLDAVDEVEETIGGPLSLDWFKQVISKGRVRSKKLDPYDSLPRQTAITDPEYKQPDEEEKTLLAEMVSSPETKKAWILYGLGVIVLAMIYVIWVKRQKSYTKDNDRLR